MLPRAAALLLALILAHAAGAEPCAPWPGEPSPLPGRADPSPARARWAQLRATELDALAAALASSRPLTASRLWRHARCLSPEDPGTAPSLPRTLVWVHAPSARPTRNPPTAPTEAPPRGVAVALAGLGDRLEIFSKTALAEAPAPLHEGPTASPAQQAAVEAGTFTVDPAAEALLAEPPEPVPAEEAQPAAPTSAEGARGEDLAAPAGTEAPVVLASPPGADPPLPDLVPALTRSRALLHAAHYEEALARVDRAQGEIQAAGGGGPEGATVGDPDWRGQRAELLIVAATAELALGRSEAAARSFERAADVAPGLELDPRGHAPKVLEAFQATQHSPEGMP